MLVDKRVRHIEAMDSLDQGAKLIPESESER